MVDESDFKNKYKVNTFDSLSISMVKSLKSRCNDDEKIIFIRGIPTIMKLTKWDLFIRRICLFLKRLIHANT
jgi:hypothetical protein